MYEKSRINIKNKMQIIIKYYEIYLFKFFFLNFNFPKILKRYVEFIEKKNSENKDYWSGCRFNKTFFMSSRKEIRIEKEERIVMLLWMKKQQAFVWILIILFLNLNATIKVLNKFSL